MHYPLMPVATAVWLVDNTSLTFQQVASFCGLHILEVKGIADGEVAKGIKGVNPVTYGQITMEDIRKGEDNPNMTLSLAPSAIKLIKEQSNNKKRRYIPVARRQDKPNGIIWLLQNFPEMTDTQISKLIGTTKNTINLIRNKTHWNYTNLRAKDPVLSGLCSQADLNYISQLVEIKAQENQESQ